MGDVRHFDASAAPPCPAKVVRETARWLARPPGGAAGRRLAGALRAAICRAGGFGEIGPRGFRVVFTSGRAEGNSQILTSAARAYAAKTGRLPHIVTGAGEDPSTLACCRGLARDGLARVTYLAPAPAGESAGAVTPAALRAALRPNTCLVSLAAACPATGAVSDLRRLGEVAHARRVPFHTDAAALFGRAAFRPLALNVDSFTASFRGLPGPPGAGLLVVRNDFAEGYGLGAHVCGPENGGLRGGLNLPALAGAAVALRRALAGRAEKNARLRALRRELRALLAGRFLAAPLDAYRAARPRVPDPDPMTPRSARVAGAPRGRRARALAGRLAAAAAAGAPVLVWVGPAGARALPGTLCLAAPRFSAERARALLAGRGYAVGGGDAPAYAAMDLPPELRGGVLCVTLPDRATRADVRALAAELAAALAAGSAAGAGGISPPPL